MEIEVQSVNDDWFRLIVDGKTVLDGHANRSRVPLKEIQEALKAYPDIKLAEIKVSQIFSCASCGVNVSNEDELDDEVCVGCW